jgi:hypothetical protein
MELSAIHVLALAGLAKAGTISFYPGTQSAHCGGSAVFCDQPTCYARVSGLVGCDGQTDAWGGDCHGGPSTLTEGLCAGAEITINNCHSTVCVDFRSAGQLFRFVCEGSGPNGEKCNDSESGTCADVGLGNC